MDPSPLEQSRSGHEVDGLIARLRFLFRLNELHVDREPAFGLSLRRFHQHRTRPGREDLHLSVNVGDMKDRVKRQTFAFDVRRSPLNVYKTKRLVEIIPTVDDVALSEELFDL